MISDQTFHLLESLERIRHLLPAQGPIKNFVHHNPLHAFQNQDFEAAVVEAAHIYHARAYMPLIEYQKLLSRGHIQNHLLDHEARLEFNHLLSASVLSQAFFHVGADSITGENILYRALREYQEFPDFEFAQCILEQEGYSVSELIQLKQVLAPLLFEDIPKIIFPRSKLSEETQIDFNQVVNPILIRLLGSYLDQGVCQWTFPNHKKGFYSSVQLLIQKSVFPLAYFVRSSQIREFHHPDAETAAERLLHILCPQTSDKETYIRESLLEHPGWSGMVSQLELNPEQLSESRPIRLIELFAVKLFLEDQARLYFSNHPKPQLRWQSKPNPYSRRLAAKQRRIDAISILLLKMGIQAQQMKDISEFDKSNFQLILSFISKSKLSSIWHRALENTAYCTALSAIESNAHRNSYFLKNLAHHKITAVFCIDDREGSLRRYLEEENAEITTESTAGFFGMDFLFQSLQDAAPVKLCPVSLKPKYLVKEKISNNSTHSSATRKLADFKVFWRDLSSSIIFGWIFTIVSAPWIFIQLVIRTYRPSLMTGFLNLKNVTPHSELDFIRTESPLEGSNSLSNQPLQGYSYEEMADRISVLLTSTGLIHRLTPLIAIIAHGSTSVNNPYFAAYDCGACSGRPGAANAKTFAQMANHPEVRNHLKKRGILLPDQIQFIGGYHDTCQDSCTFFDEESLKETHRDYFTQLKQSMKQSLMKNAKERARRFETLPLHLSEDIAHKEAQYRSIALFEPRPEMNHATNGFCIIGRRYLTADLFLDRRAFLQSYDPDCDPNGNELSNILSSIVPVCTGINLEYLFSKIDNEVYGSGTKLPHNVASLLGVMNGVDSDLRTGLPKQMVEIHDPIRCLFIIESEPEFVWKTLQNLPNLHSLFDNRWAFLAVIKPKDLSLHQYIPKKGFECITQDSHPSEIIPIVNEISTYVTQSRDNLKFALIANQLHSKAPAKLSQENPGSEQS